VAVRRQNPKIKIMRVPISEKLYEIIVSEADRLDLSMAAVMRTIISDHFEKDVATQ